MKKILCLLLSFGIVCSCFVGCGKKEEDPSFSVPLSMLEGAEDSTNDTQVQLGDSQQGDADGAEVASGNVSTVPTRNKDIDYKNLIVDIMVQPNTPDGPEDAERISYWTNVLQNQWESYVPSSALLFNYGAYLGRVKTWDDGQEYVSIICDAALFDEEAPSGALMESGTLSTPDGQQYLLIMLWEKDGTVIGSQGYEIDGAFIPENLAIKGGTLRGVKDMMDEFAQVVSVTSDDKYEYIKCFCFLIDGYAKQYADVPFEQLPPSSFIQWTLVVNKQTQELERAYLADYDRDYETYLDTYSYDFRYDINLEPPTSEQIQPAFTDYLSWISGIQWLAIDGWNYAHSKFMALVQETADERVAGEEKYPDGTYHYDMQCEDYGDCVYISLNFREDVPDADIGRGEVFNYCRFNEELPRYLADYSEALMLSVDFEGNKIKSWSAIDKYTGEELGMITEAELQQKCTPDAKTKLAGAGTLYIVESPADGIYCVEKSAFLPDGYLNIMRVNAEYQGHSFNYYQQLSLHKGTNEVLDTIAEYEQYDSFFLRLDFEGSEIIGYDVIHREKNAATGEDEYTNLGSISSSELITYFSK